MTELSPSQRERRLIVRAGLFVAVGLVLAAIVIFLIGKEGRLFDKQVIYHGAFDNVEGLTIDSPVRLGGLNVGHVSSIAFSPDLGDKRIQVQMEISSKFADRIRTDSVARVGSRGVLGDKTVEIALGSAEASQIAAGGEIPTGSSGDITSLLKTSGEVMDNVVAISRDLRQGIAAYTQPAVRSDVSGLLKSAREILEEIRSGDGALHALLYDKKGAQAISELGGAAGELATLLRDSRQNPNSAVHQLAYGDARHLMANLGSAAADLKSISAKVNSGEGTLGALINDPTVYEDLRTILGNVKRNRILRALVRFSISNGEKLDEAGKVEEKK